MIQGEAGSITKLASIFFREWILKQGFENEVFITNIVHDEINVEVKVGKEFLVKLALEESMKKSANLWCKIVPLKAEAVISSYWGH